MKGMDINKLMQQATQMQQQLQQAQERLAHETVEFSSGGGAVTVKATGDLRITEIAISPEAIDPDDPEFLGDTVVAAVNGALDAARDLQQRAMGGMLGGLGDLGLPGLQP